MPEPATIDASCEANGHPTSCTEPAPGTVVADGATTSHDVTITVGGTTKEIATISRADMDFPSHAHQYSDTDNDGTKECHDMQSHTLDPDSAQAGNGITINGSPIYLVKNGVTTDPTTGGDVDITGNPINTGVSQS